MAELTVGGIGLVGLVSLFQTCYRAYEVFIVSARNLGRDAHLLAVHLKVEQQKLRLWGQYLGISRKQQCRLLLAESLETQKLVVILLSSIKGLMDDIDIIMVRYGVKIIQSGGDLSAGDDEVGLESLNIDDIRNCAAVNIAHIRRTNTERSIAASVSRLGKIRWALSDCAKLTKLVDDLCRINEGLWFSLPKNNWLALAKGLPSFVLPEILDEATLAAVKDKASSPTTEILAACSDLRRSALISAAHEQDASFAEDLRLLPSCVEFAVTLNSNGSKAGDSSERSIASVVKPDGTKATAILEWRHVDRRFPFEDKQLARTRIKALAVLLASERPADFGLLKCIGFFKDNDEINPTRESYGLLFKPKSTLTPPSPPSQHNPPPPSSTAIPRFPAQVQPHSLYEYISAMKANPPYLGDRFRIATALCNIILQIHASSWLHKAI